MREQELKDLADTNLAIIKFDAKYIGWNYLAAMLDVVARAERAERQAEALAKAVESLCGHHMEVCDEPTTECPTVREALTAVAAYREGR